MRNLTIARLLASTLLCLCSGQAMPAEENRELFARSATARIYFDRG